MDDGRNYFNKLDAFGFETHIVPSVTIKKKVMIPPSGIFRLFILVFPLSWFSPLTTNHEGCNHHVFH